MSHEPYGFMERELAFKLLASHALVDRDFFEWLRKDPEAAAAELHIHLKEKDLNYLRNDVEWDVIAKTNSRGLRSDDAIRDALHLDRVTNSW
jgi:hypothetical protein